MLQGLVGRMRGVMKLLAGDQVQHNEDRACQSGMNGVTTGSLIVASINDFLIK